MTSEPAEPPEPPEPPEGPDEPVKPLPGAMAFVGLGTTVAGCVAVGVGGGIALDAWLGTSPLFLVLGLVLGLAAAVATVVAQVRRFL
ncbi:MAG: AtpZ/AtpI family protein [Actinomycetes bacterium]